MAAGEGKNESSSNLAYDSAELQEIEAEIARLVVLSEENLRRTDISSEPGDYYDFFYTNIDLASLYARKRFLIESELLRREAMLTGGPVLQPELPRAAEADPSGDVVQQQEIGIASSSNQCEEEDDDWEALADNEASLANLSLSSPPENTAVSEPPTEDEPGAPIRRRGRGSFLYGTNELYSDQMDDAALDQVPCINSSQEAPRARRSQQYGTSHVLLLFDLPPTIRTTHLESLFENFSEGGLAIRWVSDTVAFAVFGTPAAAHEAKNRIKFPFKVRRLAEGDIALHKISQEDLEPPTARPMTSARTAQRMIGHAIGMELGSSSSSSTSPRLDEFRMQEAARRDRLHQRHDMKDAAWGPDQ